MKKLILIRGWSGSGKTTMSDNLLTAIYFHSNNSDLKSVSLEADMFFSLNDSGDYNFNPKLLPQAHKWCQLSTLSAMNNGVNFIVVSNTFTQLWEMEEYFNLAEEYGYDVEFVEMKGEFENVHNVPKEVVDRQKARYEELPAGCKIFNLEETINSQKHKCVMYNIDGITGLESNHIYLYESKPEKVYPDGSSDNYGNRRDCWRKL